MGASDITFRLDLQDPPESGRSLYGMRPSHDCTGRALTSAAVTYQRADVAMTRAIECALAARSGGNRAHGAVAFLDDLEVARGDETVSRGDPTAHPIALVVTEIAARLGSWRLDGVTVVATHEPCAMCAGALVAGRARELVFGLSQRANGAAGSRYQVLRDPRLGHELTVRAGVAVDRCAELDRGS
jgi:tRNA(adenine34) deaminase